MSTTTMVLTRWERDAEGEYPVEIDVRLEWSDVLTRVEPGDIDATVDGVGAELSWAEWVRAAEAATDRARVEHGLVFRTRRSA